MADVNDLPVRNPNHITTWLEYVERFAKLYECGKKLTQTRTTGRQDFTSLPINAERHDIIICSPHPDDEALTGALAYRLMSENTHVLNLAITLGSNPERKETRKAELAASCKMLGFDCRLVQEPLAFSDIDNKKKSHTSDQQYKINALVDHFDREGPALALLPHADDGHPTHRDVHYLAMAALRQHSQKNDRNILVAETEFWHPMKNPNLLLGLGPKEIAGLMAALTCHWGEIERNPYHLSLPARFMDNVRRGAEIILHSRDTPDFMFAEMYRLSRIHCGRREETSKRSIIIPPEKIITLAELGSLSDSPDY